MSSTFIDHIRGELRQMSEAGLCKGERLITTPQSVIVRTVDGRQLINLCANNYLGLSSHPAVVNAAQQALQMIGNK